MTLVLSLGAHICLLVYTSAVSLVRTAMICNINVVIFTTHSPCVNDCVRIAMGRHLNEDGLLSATYVTWSCLDFLRLCDFDT